ncbi:hypothetical protein Nepgr_023103 [Nepenthes gracilis]|uniref:Uncharacterized protein n=1 Tax=Nepenthes gracilis TaxID=150966 RepID=A0AAD3T3Q6_NEPGR|nr:hypothetical protein Nepgr_023103 [Nepenthes gracilis]
MHAKHQTGVEDAELESSRPEKTDRAPSSKPRRTPMMTQEGREAGKREATERSKPERPAAAPVPRPDEGAPLALSACERPFQLVPDLLLVLELLLWLLGPASDGIHLLVGWPDGRWCCCCPGGGAELHSLRSWMLTLMLMLLLEFFEACCLCFSCMGRCQFALYCSCDQILDPDVLQMMLTVNWAAVQLGS